MKRKFVILNLFFLFGLSSFMPAQNSRTIQFEFLGDVLEVPFDNSLSVPYGSLLQIQSIEKFYQTLDADNYQPAIDALLKYKDEKKLEDWLYYQLVRKTAQQVSPKAENYYRYTLYKWFLLVKSGYDAIIRVSENKILFYVQSDENIYNIPYRIQNNKQYVCLNYHDYGYIDFDKETFYDIRIQDKGVKKTFSYKITQLPEFRPGDYVEKDIRFTYYQQDYSFKVKLNPQVQILFTNYPSLDYSYYFGIPMSPETYSSLIPSLKKSVKGMNVRNGVDYLMHFTRYAFMFKKDAESFGKEKRLSPEETLLYNESDCEDRVSLFFYLVKEIYDLPMIVLAYPDHVTIAVGFDKPIGEGITYNGKKYTVCEPTPQKKDLAIGKLLPELKKKQYEIAYEYNPSHPKNRE